MHRAVWVLVGLAIVSWANFVLAASVTGRADPLAWLAATTVSSLTVVALATPRVETVGCPECGQPASAAPFCLGCGRFPKLSGNRIQ